MNAISMNQYAKPQMSVFKPLISPSEIELWLRWAGEKLLSLPLARPGPAGLRNNWPEVEPEDTKSIIAAAFDETRIHAPEPDKYEIRMMDEILSLILLVQEPHVRRVLQTRALVAPLTGRYLYSWSRIGKVLKIDRRAVIKLHAQGTSSIARRADQVKLLQIKEFMSKTEIAPTLSE